EDFGERRRTCHGGKVFVDAAKDGFWWRGFFSFGCKGMENHRCGFTLRPPNHALHRTAICAAGLSWGFCFICQFVAVGELTSLDHLARMSDEAPKKQTSPKLKRVDGPPKPPTRVTLDLNELGGPPPEDHP